MKKKRHRVRVQVMLVAGFAAWVGLQANAQSIPGAHTLSVGYGAAFLTGGDNPADWFTLTVERRVPRLPVAVMARAGYLRSVDRNDEVILGNPYLWRDQHHGNVDLALQPSFAFRLAGSTQQPGLRLGASYRYRHDERVDLAFHSGWFENIQPEARPLALEDCRTDANWYCNELENGLLAFHTYDTRAHDLGAFLEVFYRVTVRHVSVAGNAGYFRYRKQNPLGSHMYFYGVTLGVAL